VSLENERRDPAAHLAAGSATAIRTKIVKTDMIPKDFVTLALRDATERQVLETLFRATGGFIVASRDADDPDASRVDLIAIMQPNPAPPLVTAIAAPACPRTPPAARLSSFIFTAQQMLVPPDPRSTSPGSELPLEGF